MLSKVRRLASGVVVTLGEADFCACELIFYKFCAIEEPKCASEGHKAWRKQFTDSGCWLLQDLWTEGAHFGDEIAQNL